MIRSFTQYLSRIWNHLRVGDPTIPALNSIDEAPLEMGRAEGLLKWPNQVLGQCASGDDEEAPSCQAFTAGNEIVDDKAALE